MTTKMAEEQQEVPTEVPEEQAEAAAPQEAEAAEAPAAQEDEATAEDKPTEDGATGDAPADAAEQKTEGEADAPATDATQGEGTEEVEREVSAEATEAAEGEAPGGDQPEAEPEGEAEGEGQPEGEGEGEVSGESPSGEDPAAAEAPEGTTEGSEQVAVDSEQVEGDGTETGEAAAAGAEGEAGDGATPGDGGEGAPEGEEQAAEGQEAAPAEGDQEQEGEATDRPTSPIIEVAEKLSREGSVIEEEPQDTGRTESPPVPGSPEQGSIHDGIIMEEDEEDDEEEEEEEEEEEVPQFDREQLVERYHQALSEREQLQQQNYGLQHKLAEYFRKKKSDDARQDIDKNVTDHDQRYLKYMANLEELRRQDAEEREHYKIQIEDLKDKCGEKQMSVEDERAKFTDFKKQVALNAVNSRSGKPILPKDIEQYLATENRKEAEVVNVRLENIKLKNKLRKKELQLKSKEELAEGLHLIDFEQLKIENQTYNEKIEERNEELLKLRKKITSTVQVLTHLKEKLQFVQAENHILKGSLQNIEEDAAKQRDKLTRTKQSRDQLRIDNNRLKQSCGLLGNEPLLRDFEDRKDESEDLREKLERLKMQHAELTLSCNGVRKKIEQAHQGRT